MAVAFTEHFTALSADLPASGTFDTWNNRGTATGDFAVPTDGSPILRDSTVVTGLNGNRGGNGGHFQVTFDSTPTDPLLVWAVLQGFDGSPSSSNIICDSPSAARKFVSTLGDKIYSLPGGVTTATAAVPTDGTAVLVYHLFDGSDSFSAVGETVEVMSGAGTSSNPGYLFFYGDNAGVDRGWEYDYLDMGVWEVTGITSETESEIASDFRAAVSVHLWPQYRSQLGGLVSQGGSLGASKVLRKAILGC